MENPNLKKFLSRKLFVTVGFLIFLWVGVALNNFEYDAVVRATQISFYTVLFYSGVQGTIDLASVIMKLYTDHKINVYREGANVVEELQNALEDETKDTTKLEYLFANKVLGELKKYLDAESEELENNLKGDSV